MARFIQNFRSYERYGPLPEPLEATNYAVRCIVAPFIHIYAGLLRTKARKSQ